MSDPRVVNLARILVNYSTEVKEKDLVAIYGSPLSTPLIREVFREVLRKGAYPYVLVRNVNRSIPGLEGLDYVFFQEANDDQLSHVDFISKKVVEEFDVLIHIFGQYNTSSISSIDPKRFNLRLQSYSEITKTYIKRADARDLRRVCTNYPNPAYAQDAEMSLEEYADYLYSTTFADCEDPVAKWNNINTEQQRIIDWLIGKKDVKVVGPDVDLTLSIEGRTFLNGNGKVNMPCGEIFTSPIEDSVNGWIRITHPSMYAGRMVEGIELTFESGKVIKASAEKNEETLLTILETDKGSRFLGEFAIGTNKQMTKFMKDILFDEKIGGTIHIALGSGFPSAGSKNTSSIHWDILCDMRDGGQIFVDDELFYESGKFLIK